MPPESRKIIRQLSDHILETGIGNYLVSGQFTRFCRAHEIEDIRSAALELSRDKPQLYGRDVVKNAFFFVPGAYLQQQEGRIPKHTICTPGGRFREVSCPPICLSDSGGYNPAGIFPGGCGERIFNQEKPHEALLNLIRTLLNRRTKNV